MLPFEQRIEGVEKLLLRMLLTGEELDVVDQQRMQRAVRGFEIVDAVVLQGPNHVADETLGMYIRHARVLVALRDHVADGMHRGVLPQAAPAINEQRVVGAAW